MNKQKLLNEIYKAADKDNKRPLEFFCKFIDIVSVVAIDREEQDQSLKETAQFFGRHTKLLKTFEKVAEANPWTDFLGEIKVELGAINSSKGQFYTPEQLALGVLTCASATKRPTEPKSFADISCGTGIFQLKAIQKLLPDLEAKPSEYRKQKDIFENHYFFMCDTDELAVKIAAIQLRMSLYAHNIVLPNELKVPMFKLEAICGDGLFLKKNHEIIFSNTGRELYEIPIVQRYKLYEEETKKFNLIRTFIEILPQLAVDIREDLEAIKANKLKGEKA